MKKKILIVFLICCMFFGVASPAFAVSSYMYEPFPDYDLQVQVGSTRLSSGLYHTRTFPQFLVLKDNFPLGIMIQTTYNLEQEIALTPPNVFASYDNENYTFTFYIEDNDRIINSDIVWYLTNVDESNMQVGTVQGGLYGEHYEEINGVSYFVGTKDISRYESIHASSLYDFTNGTDASSIHVWDNGPTTQLVGELPPQMMNLGITQVEVPTAQQVVGMIQTVLPFGISLLASFLILAVLLKVFQIYRR